MPINININFKPKQFQQELIDAIDDPSTRRVVLCCARQIGKSYVLRYILLKWLLRNETTKILYCTITLRLARLFYEQVDTMLPKQFVKSANSQTLSITLHNGNSIMFTSSLTASTVRGYSFSHGIFDEYAFHLQHLPNSTETLWDNIFSPTFDSFAGREKIVFCSTPNGYDNKFQEEYAHATHGKKGYRLVKATIFDDETKDREWVEEKREGLNEMAWRQEYMCEFIRDGVSFFKNYDHCFNGSGVVGSNRWIGIDLSANGEDATILSVIDEFGQLSVKEITGNLDQKYDKLAELITNEKYLNAVYIEKNGVGAPMINEIKKRVQGSRKSLIHEWLTTNDSKTEIITEMGRLLEANKLNFHRTDTATLSEFGTYSFKRSNNGKMIFNALPGYHDDRIMATAIAIRCRLDFPLKSSVPFMVVK